MHFIVRAVTNNDFEDFYRVIYYDCGFDDTPKEDVRKEWEVLRRARGMPGVVVEDRLRDKSRVVGYAQLAFLTERFAQACLHPEAEPYVNRRLLAAERRGEKPLLTEEEIARANAGPGLIALTAYYGWDRARLDPDEQIRVRDFLNATFLEQYRGFRIREILLEVTGETNYRMALNTGLFVRNNYSDHCQHASAVVPDLYPTLMGITADEARRERAGAAINAAFVYAPPRFYFREEQRSLLRLALDGLDDTTISKEEGVTADAIKKRWDSIFKQVQDHDEELLPEGKSGKQRGKEKRTLLLRYLDQHREELRPYATPPPRSI